MLAGQLEKPEFRPSACVTFQAKGKGVGTTGPKEYTGDGSGSQGPGYGLYAAFVDPLLVQLSHTHTPTRGPSGRSYQTGLQPISWPETSRLRFRIFTWAEVFRKARDREGFDLPTGAVLKDLHFEEFSKRRLGPVPLYPLFGGAFGGCDFAGRKMQIPFLGFTCLMLGTNSSDCGGCLVAWQL